MFSIPRSTRLSASSEFGLHLSHVETSKFVVEHKNSRFPGASAHGTILPLLAHAVLLSLGRDLQI